MFTNKEKILRISRHFQEFKKFQEFDIISRNCRDSSNSLDWNRDFVLEEYNPIKGGMRKFLPSLIYLSFWTSYFQRIFSSSFLLNTNYEMWYIYLFYTYLLANHIVTKFVKKYKKEKIQKYIKKKKIYAQRVEELIDKRKNFAPRITNWPLFKIWIIIFETYIDCSKF